MISTLPWFALRRRPPADRPRVEVRPPSLRQSPDSVWERTMFWLLAPAPHAASPSPRRLGGVRSAFDAVVADIDGADAARVRARIAAAASLRDFWHLRVDCYRVIGLAHGERVAERRLATTNRHFSTRAPRAVGAGA